MLQVILLVWKQNISLVYYHISYEDHSQSVFYLWN
jgi:hypothetical protein